MRSFKQLKLPLSTLISVTARPSSIRCAFSGVCLIFGYVSFGRANAARIALYISLSSFIFASRFLLSVHRDPCALKFTGKVDNAFSFNVTAMQDPVTAAAPPLSHECHTRLFIALCARARRYDTGIIAPSSMLISLTCEMDSSV